MINYKVSLFTLFFFNLYILKNKENKGNSSWFFIFFVMKARKTLVLQKNLRPVACFKPDLARSEGLKPGLILSGASPFLEESSRELHFRSDPTHRLSGPPVGSFLSPSFRPALIYPLLFLCYY